MADLGYSLPQCERDWALFDNVTEACDSARRPAIVMSEDSDLSDDSEKLLWEHQRRSRKVNVGRCLQSLSSGAVGPSPVGSWNGRGARGGAFYDSARMAFDDCLSQGFEVFSGEDVLSASEDEFDLEIVNQFLSARNQVMPGEGGSMDQPYFLMPGDKLLPSRYQPCLLVSPAGDGPRAHLPGIPEVQSLRGSWPAVGRSLEELGEKLEPQSLAPDLFPALCGEEGRPDTPGEEWGFDTTSSRGTPTHCTALVPAAASSRQEDYSISVPEVYEYFYADSDCDDDQNTFFFMRIPLASTRANSGPGSTLRDRVLTSIGSLVRDCLDPSRQGHDGQMSVWDPVGYGVSEGDSPSRALGDTSMMSWDGASERSAVRPQAPDTGGSCSLSLQRKDICMFCFACVSWVMKSLSSHSDMWKAALLVNIGAISAVRYFRQHMTKEKSKCLLGSWPPDKQPGK